MPVREPQSFKVTELKDILKKKGLSTKGSKVELINRLMSNDAQGEWLHTNNNDEDVNTTMGRDDDRHDNASVAEDSQRSNMADEDIDGQACRAEGNRTYEHEEARALTRRCELLRREKELAERELEVARRELEIMRMSQHGELPHAHRTTTAGRNSQTTDTSSASTSVSQRKINVTAVADLLHDFNGCAEDFEKWERQVRFLRTAYQLDDNLTKILIGTRLKGRALDWFHSKSEYIMMTSDELLDELRGMFFQRPNKITLRRRFEARVWKRGETFHDYVHEKVIMANRISVDDDEILGYIIEGIPDMRLRDLARVQGFSTRDQMLQAFEEIRLEDRRHPTSTTTKSNDGTGAEKNKSDKNAASDSSDRKVASADKWSVPKRCFNCGLKDHVSAKCPSKEKGTKCFECNEHGHIASNCPSKPKTTNSCVVARPMGRKHPKDVLINDIQVQAIIDTGSDITIMRADEFVKIGSPRLVRKPISFRGVGRDQNTTIGEFSAKLTVDENSYEITVHVVSDELSRFGLLIGKDFLDTVELNVKLGVTTIKPIKADDDVSAEICQISVDYESEINSVDLSHLQDEKIEKKLQMLIDNYRAERTRDVGVRMKLLLKDDEPVNLRPRRLTLAEKNEVNKQIDEWLETGIVQLSVSDYASPIVLVKKKDGSTRLCVDYRLLNKKVIKDRYPLPLIEDQLDALQDAKVFSTLDLKNGFFHVPVDDASRKYTAFVVPDGHYEFVKMPFGLCNAPAVFQKFINVVFKDLIRQHVVLIYMDDLIIPSVDIDSGVSRLESVLNTASKSGLVINWKKSNLLRTRVDYLGHVIEEGRIRPSELKTLAVKNFSAPTNIRQVQQFLGLTGYFRKFIPGYSIIARPLTNLLRSEIRFKFEALEISAFNKLKSILIDKPVLKLYRIGAETELHTDASLLGYGAILLQRSNDDNAMHPVYYASGKTTPTEQKYISYELEVLAIVKALKKFRVYLLHTPFKIVTDCRAFTLTMSKKDLCLRVARWALMLEDYNYQIEHRSGKSMGHVDALSRNPLPTCLLLNEDEDGLTAQLRRAQLNDENTKKIIQLTQEGKTHGYSIRGGLLFKEVDGDTRLVVPKAMCSQIIKCAHERGHFSVAKTEAIVKRDYHIPDLRAKIEKHIRNCINCILANKRQGKQEGFLCPIDKGEIPLDTYHVDHLGPLATTKKSYRYILAVIDGFSKFTWLYATRSTSTSEVLNRLRRQAAIFGNPRRIISDRGTAFTSGDFTEYCKQEGIQHVLTTTGVPRANGQVERLNRTLISLLTKLAAPKPEEWHRYLDVAQQYFNTTIQRSIAMSPFYLLFGTHARLREDHNVRELLEQEWASSFQEKRDELRLQAKESIIKIQQENKRSFDKKRKAAGVYQEGDLVAIKRMQQAPGSKLAAKYFGPYEILKKLRNHRYVVRKVGEHNGPQQTSSSVDYMKPWLNYEDGEELSGDEEEWELKENDCISEREHSRANVTQDGRM